MNYNIIKGLVLLVILVIISISSKHTFNQGTKFYNTVKENKVYDISFKYLPNYSRYKKYKDLFLLLIVFIVLQSPKIFEIIHDITSLFITILLIRSVTIMTTILPKTTRSCKPHFSITGHCFDFIFSGHFSLGLLSTMILFKYGETSMLFLVIFNILHAMAILVTKSHYTIDILVGGLVTGFVFQNNLMFL